MSEDGVDGGHDVLAVNEDGAIGAISECDVEDGAVFGDVDFVAAEHAIAPFLDFGVSGEVQEEAEGFIGDAIFGEIQENVAEAKGEFFESFRVFGEKIAHVDRREGLEMRKECLPRMGLGEGAHGDKV